MPKIRGGKKKSVKPAFRIYCEGEKTEPNYIRAYINHFHSEYRNFIVVEDTKKNTPVQLVEAAVNDKMLSDSNDIYWVVFDRESKAKYSDDLHMKARNKAKDNGVEIGFSNVCFEYWFLLHFKYTDAAYQSCNDLLKQSQLRNLLKGVGIADYDKGFSFIFEKLKEKIPVAIENAKRLKTCVLSTADLGKEAPYFLNPYVDVHELFLDMKQFTLGLESVRKSM